MKQFADSLFFFRKISEHAILQNLERAAKKGMFAPPMFTDENLAYGKSRLTAFRSDTEWILTFEYLVYIGEADEYRNILYSYGNKIKKDFHSIELFKLTAFGDEVDPLDFEVTIKDRKKRFRVTVDDYLDCRVDLNKALSGDTTFDARLHILRLLVNILRPEDLYHSKFDLLRTVGRPITTPIFLQLHEWQHPDPRLLEKRFLTPCLQSLIKAIAKNAPDEYECSPALINTHWSSWPSFGLKEE